MNRLILFIVVFISVFTTSFGYMKRPSLPAYEIISDSYDSTLRKGVCLVEGNVYGDGKVIHMATVKTTSHKYSCETNDNGFYQLKITAKDSQLFAYHPNYGEIVMRNYDFKSRHKVVINFNFETKSSLHQNVKKPVIYAYSSKPIYATIQVTHPGMKFQYPTCSQSGWSVQVNSNFVIDQLTDKAYPYLFWEAQTDNLKFLQNEKSEIEGYVVKSDTVVQFLENILAHVGLNSTEKTDFITFWCPQFVQSNFIVMQFLIDTEYDELVAPIIVNPKPDSMRRIFLQFALVNSMDEIAFPIVEPKLSTFNRQGFSIIEWGGAEIQLPQVHP